MKDNSTQHTKEAVLKKVEKLPVEVPNSGRSNCSQNSRQLSDCFKLPTVTENVSIKPESCVVHIENSWCQIWFKISKFARDRTGSLYKQEKVKHALVTFRRSKKPTMSRHLRLHANYSELTQPTEILQLRNQTFIQKTITRCASEETTSKLL